MTGRIDITSLFRISIIELEEGREVLIETTPSAAKGGWTCIRGPEADWMRAAVVKFIKEFDADQAPDAARPRPPGDAMKTDY